MALLESLESQMKLERRTRVESDAQVRDLETKHAESQLKSQQIITGLKTQVAEQTQTRVCTTTGRACGIFTVMLYKVFRICYCYGSGLLYIVESS